MKKSRFGGSFVMLGKRAVEMQDKIFQWEKRKEEALAHLAQADQREQKLVLADKLANMRAIARDYAKYGEDLWQRFKRGKNIQSWYYHAAVQAMSDLEFDAEAGDYYKRFPKLVSYVFAGCKIVLTHKIQHGTMKQIRFNIKRLRAENGSR